MYVIKEIAYSAACCKVCIIALALAAGGVVRSRGSLRARDLSTCWKGKFLKLCSKKKGNTPVVIFI